MDNGAKEIDADTFREAVLENVKPVMVDFYAEWCGPCRMMSPVVDRLAEEFRDRIDIVKLDTDRAHDLCRELEVHALPTVIVFWAGEAIAKLVGFHGEDTLRKQLQKAERTADGYRGSAGDRATVFPEGAD